jgi:ubiquinone/menaquinone biosynthesis C-methylase UbiE
MAHGHDVERFDRWATTYDRHWMQRRIFEPIQKVVLELAADEVARPRSILDVGCGTGRLLRSAAATFPGTSLTGVDAAPGMVRQAAASGPAGDSIRFQQATAEDLPFPSGSFDLVFSTMTFHHWHDQRRGMAEVSRLLTPRGRWLLADFMPVGLMRPVRRLLRWEQFRDHGELEAMLAGAGLATRTARRVPGLGGQVTVLAIGAGALTGS